MAAEDFIIAIRTTADTAGIKATEAELRKLGVQVESVKRAAIDTGGGIGGASLVGRLAGTLAGGVGLASIVNLVKEYAGQVNRATAEIDKQAGKVVELSQAWGEAAKSALTAEDVQKLALSGVKELDAISDRITQIATQDVPAAMDTMTDIVSRAFKFAFTGDPNVKGPQQQIAENLMGALAQQREILKQNKIFDIGVAETTKAQFEDLAELPIDESFGKASDKLSELVDKQQQLKADSPSFLEDYNKLTKQIQLQQTIMAKLLELEKQRKKEVQETADEREKDKDFWQEQVNKSSTQVKSILQNEQAAAVARGEGRGLDAGLFERSVEALKRGATPQELKELAPLEKAIKDQNIILGQIRDAWQ